MKQTFGQILKEIRRTKNISQRELANQAGVDFTYISKLENDKLPPPAVETVLKLADILDIPKELFLATSGKVENEIRETIAGSAEAVKFLNEAKQMQLTNAEWDKLLINLKKLR
jgi:transcriptional regulator with XRE-family HTH domain